MTGIKYALAIGNIADGFVYTGLWDTETDALRAAAEVPPSKHCVVVEIVAHDKDNLPLSAADFARMKLKVRP